MKYLINSVIVIYFKLIISLIFDSVLQKCFLFNYDETKLTSKFN